MNKLVGDAGTRAHHDMTKLLELLRSPDRSL